jgi:hypothetical protein
VNSKARVHATEVDRLRRDLAQHALACACEKGDLKRELDQKTEQFRRVRGEVSAKKSEAAALEAEITRLSCWRARVSWLGLRRLERSERELEEAYAVIEQFEQPLGEAAQGGRSGPRPRDADEVMMDGQILTRSRSWSETEMPLSSPPETR